MNLLAARANYLRVRGGRPADYDCEFRGASAPRRLVDGVQMGRPGYTQDFIFAENARTLTW